MKVDKRDNPLKKILEGGKVISFFFIHKEGLRVGVKLFVEKDGVIYKVIFRTEGIDNIVADYTKVKG